MEAVHFIQTFLKKEEMDFVPEAAFVIAFVLLDTLGSAATFLATGFSSSSSPEMERFIVLMA